MLSPAHVLVRSPGVIEETLPGGRDPARGTRGKGCEMTQPATHRPQLRTDVRDLVEAGLLEIGDAAHIAASAVFEPADRLGTLRPILIGERARIEAGAVLHGGVSIAAGARIEEPARA
jgi:acetyltransferase-like isoleucine patch superfamily enzyme